MSERLVPRLRAELLAQVTPLLRPGQPVTLVGAGGMGKTWLARRVQPERALFVDCIPATTLDDLTRLIADGLGRGTRGTVHDMLADLGATLREGEHLLVLDNLEQVLQPARLLVAALIQANAEVLCTSRVALSVPGEQICHVGPLSGAESLAHFLRHADPQTTDAVRHANVLQELLALLDGNPLAIEIAAGNTPLVSPQQLLERLASHEELVDLAGRPARHRSLAQVGEQSWRNLEPGVQAALRRLALLEGAWTLDTALAVGVGIQALETLRRWSFVQRQQTLPHVRFRISAVLRGWLLRDHPPTLEDRQAVANWVLETATSAWAGVGGKDEVPHRRRLAERFADLERAASDSALPHPVRVDAVVLGASHLQLLHSHHALQFLDEHADVVAVREERRKEQVLLRARALRRMGRQDEGLLVLDQALAGPWHPHAEGELRAERTFLLASGRHRSQSTDEGERAVALLANAGTPAEALAYRQLGVAYRVAHHEAEKGRTALQRSIALSRRLGRVADEVTALAQLMQVSTLVDAEAADALYRQGLEAAERSGARSLLAMLDAQYALRLLWDCNVEQARQVVPRAVEGYRTTGHRFAANNLRCRMALAEATDQPGDVARAALHTLLDEARRTQVCTYEPDMLCAFGVLDHLDGHVERALERYVGAELRAVELDRGNARGLARQLQAFARAELDGGQPSGSEDPVVLAVESAWRGSLQLEALQRILGDDRVGHMTRLRARVAERSARMQRCWVFQSDGRAFASPSGERVDLGRRQASRRILEALVHHRLQFPEASLTSIDLIERGWPGAQIKHESAQARLWTAIRDLRTLGLETVLHTSGDGYRLDPTAQIRRVDDLVATEHTLPPN